MSLYEVVFTRAAAQWASVVVDAVDEDAAYIEAEYLYNSGTLELDWQYDTSDDGISLVRELPTKGDSDV